VRNITHGQGVAEAPEIAVGRDLAHGKPPVGTALFAGNQPRRRHMKNDRVANPATKELSDADLGMVTGGSQSSGSGAGKITFNPFSIARKIDRASPTLF
jgi:hypothetical protein